VKGPLDGIVTLNVLDPAAFDHLQIGQTILVSFGETSSSRSSRDPNSSLCPGESYGPRCGWGGGGRACFLTGSSRSKTVSCHETKRPELARTAPSVPGWTQAELAARAGTSRAEVSAIETGRHVPRPRSPLPWRRRSSAASRTCSSSRDPSPGPSGPGRRVGCRAAFATRGSPAARSSTPQRRATSGPRSTTESSARRESRSAGTPRPRPDPRGRRLRSRPAVPLPGARASHGCRLILLTRSSREALDLLGKRLVHVAGVHLGEAGRRGGNARVVRNVLGPGYRLLRHARWQEGVALGSSLEIDFGEGRAPLEPPLDRARGRLGSPLLPRRRPPGCRGRKIPIRYTASSTSR
jgi:hypothetical protein